MVNERKKERKKGKKEKGLDEVKDESSFFCFKGQMEKTNKSLKDGEAKKLKMMKHEQRFKVVGVRT